MEAVVIFRKDQADDKTKDILQSLHRTQEFSERVFVIEEDKSTIESIRKLHGVMILNELTVAIKKMLSAVEVLSLDAWKKRKSKERIGDGVSWGSRDFKAPR